MEDSKEKGDLKRKLKLNSLPENLKSSDLSSVIQSTLTVIQRITSTTNNDEKKLFAHHQKPGVFSSERIIKTLIRGLGSSNTQIQTNYFAILISLLKSFESTHEFSAGNVLDAVKSELHATGNITKGEEREILMGRVLSFCVLVRSGSLKTASEEEQTTAVKQFLHDVKEKSYLPLVGDPFFMDFLKQVDESSFKNTVWPLLSKQVRPGPEQTLLIYHALLVSEELFPSVVTSKYLKQTLNSPRVLSSKTVSGLLESLKGEYKLKALNHPAYSDIFKYLVSSSEEVLFSFWQEVEKQLLVEASTTYNKQIVAMKFFSIIVSQLQEPSQVLSLLTPKLLSWFMKRNKATGFPVKILHKSTKEALDNLLKLCAKADSPKTTLSVLKKLIFNPGNVLFDQFSGTKVVWQMVGQLKEKQTNKLSLLLKDVISGASHAIDQKDGEDVERPWTNREKLYSVHLLCRLLFLSSTQTSLEWRLHQLTFLFDMGFFPAPNTGVELAGSIRESFFSCLNHKLASLSDLQVVLAGIVQHINKRLNNGDQLRIKVPSEVLPAWNKMFKTAKKLGEDKKEQIWLPKVFQTMFYHIALHLFKEASFAIDVLQELHSVYERVNKSTHSKDEPHWTEVVVEMFLSLLSRNSQLHRHLLGCVFSHFCQIMIPQNIYQILQVLDPTNNTNPLLNSLDSDSDNDSEEEGSEEQGAGDDKEEEESSDDGMTDGDDVNMEEDEEDKVNDKLRRAVIEALGETGAMTDTESVDLENMDDDEAKRVDKALSEAFQAFKPSKKKKESTHVKALTHFRLRVLDLIEVWLVRADNPPLDLTVDVLLKLISLLEHSLVDKQQAALETRVRSVIKKFTIMAGKKKYNLSDCKELHLGKILKSLLDKGDRSTTVYMSISKELIASTVFIVKVSQQVSESDNETEDGEDISVYSVLKDAMNSYFTQRDCLLPFGLFQNLYKLNVPFLSKLASKLPSYAFEPNVHSFRRSKALEFLISFWKNNRIVQQSSEDHTVQLQKTARKLYKASVKMIEDPTGKVPHNFLQHLRRALLIIQEKKWLQDVDLQKHLDDLTEFHKTLTRTKKETGQGDATSNDAMEIENNEEISKKIGAENEEESENSENDENDSEEEDDDEEEVNNTVQGKEKKSSSKQEKAQENNVSKQDSEEESIEEKDESEEEKNEESPEVSEESPSETEEPPSKKSKKKADKKKNREKLRRIQLLKNNSKKMRMESMSVGLDENVFSKYKLLLNKSASPER